MSNSAATHVQASRTMVQRALAAAVCAAMGMAGVGCAGEAPDLVAHRALGVPGAVAERGENRAANVVPTLRAGFGVEIDVRSDGEKPFALGHERPSQDTLGEVLDQVESAWDPAWAGRVLILDVANNTRGGITRDLMGYLNTRLAGPLSALDVVVQGSSIGLLAQLHGARTALGPEAPARDVKLAMTYWMQVPRTVPHFVDYVTAHQAVLGSMDHPHPVLLFGVTSRADYRQAANTRAVVRAIITDHPRRFAR